ncbi:3-oxoacyl-[acyl-carrier-protein] synthase, mitochondrial [Ceratocystis fimbriata CBS 114723]|uniref:3-oxoacyl-[acyl-carrier-protein] synthase n=2 Tax=Ceratocystis TaxID=5157 RepID=A0A2C5WUV1_9PEZI|nr:3-oxoacyl-[acyl-carrier-protein] synthase, mitochondrial [Ceratocystis fimbriata CBS 114723]
MANASIAASGMRRVVITGLGALCPLGVGVQHVWKRLAQGASGLVSVAQNGPEWKSLTSTVGGVVPLDMWSGGAGFVTSAEKRRLSLFSQYAIAAADMALDDAQWKPKDETDRAQTGVSIGNGIGGFQEIRTQSRSFDGGGQKKVSPLFVPLALHNMAAGHIAMRYSFTGPGDCHSTACTTGADAIGSAARAVAYGDCDVMLAGGSESCVNPLAFAGFGRARSLATAFNDDPAHSCRPFDQSRDGFVLAEGAAVLVLEELEHARNRGARIYAEIKGYGRSMDAHHMTAPWDDGRGALKAMQRALKDARISADQVDYINAHATGTVVGDKAEAAAIAALLRGCNNKAMVSSTKGATGHLLGAAGALEALFSVLAISENMLPPTLNLHNPDREIDPSLRFVGPKAVQMDSVDTVISNSFGFGGMNASLVFSRLSV